MFGWRQLDGRLRFVDEPLHERLVDRELGADLFDDQLLLEAARPAERGQEDARHAADGDQALEDVFAEDLREHGAVPSVHRCAGSRGGGADAYEVGAAPVAGDASDG